MKHVLLAGAGLFVLAMAQPSVAADMPRPVTKAPAMVAAPMFNWSGFYVGGNVGYGWGKYKEELFDGGSSVASESIGLDGAFVGGQIGANVQTGSIVWGVEADIQKSWIGGDERWAFPGLTVTAEVEVDWFATLRGRVGIAHGPSLFFLTGGIAHGEGTGKLTINGASGSASDDRTGWTVGAGYEAALGDNWSWKLEYLYIDYGTEKTNLGGGFSAESSIHNHIVRVGLNYRFGGGKAPAPVLTRY